MGMIIDVINQAIAHDGRSRNAIARASGLEGPHLLRVLKGEAGLSLATLERVMHVLRIRMVVGGQPTPLPTQVDRLDVPMPKDATESKPRALSPTPIKPVVGPVQSLRRAEPLPHARGKLGPQ